MPRPTRGEMMGFVNDLGGNELTELRRVLHAILSLVTGQNPDGTPFHPDSGTATSYTAVPTPAGAQLPSTPCKYVVLRNRSGVNVNYTLSGGAQLPLYNGQDERINVDNASQVKLFDADNSAAQVGWIAVV